MKQVRQFLVPALAFALVLALSQSALGFQILKPTNEATQNAYGLWYAPANACDECHAKIVSAPTVHSTFVTNVQAKPAKLLPSADKWPAPSPLGGLSIGASSIFLQIGDRYGMFEYAGFAQGAGDLPLYDPVAWSVEYGKWEEPEAKIGSRDYSQSCSACHNTGVTRPSNATYTLANGAIQSTSTPSGVVDLSIGCQVCHGSGEMDSKHVQGVPRIVGGVQILRAQVCGQCHMSGATPQKNVAGGAFGNPNGYTTDENLADYITPYTTVPTEADFAKYLASLDTTAPMKKPYFLPNGANYSLRHSYYNEWLLNKVESHSGGMKGHADPVNSSAAKDPKCLGCHSGLGFLNRIGTKDSKGNLLVTASMITTSNDIGISCQVCHDGHVTYKTGGGYDFARKWGDGKSVSCGDCHNWQFEVLGQTTQQETVGVLPIARPAANTRSRHPQREMRAGGANGGMWGVGVVTGPMSELACADCHMPRTHKEGMPADDNGDAVATRKSHRFHVVEPGQAAAWKLRNGGDSCAAQCHVGAQADYSRQDFQDWIDQQQAIIAAKVTAVTEALNADATSLGLSSWTSFIAAQPTSGAAANLTGTQWATLQKAAQNLDIVTGDGSGGIHNPDYAKAGLNVAFGMAKYALIDKTAPSLVVSAIEGSTFSEMAMIRPGGRDNQSGVASVVYSLDGGPWITKYGQAAALTISAPGAHELVVKAVDAAGNTSAPKTVEFKVTAATRISNAMSASSYTRSLGSTLKFVSVVKRVNGSRVLYKNVVLQRYAGGKWSDFASVRTDATGTASRSFKFSTKGIYSWRWKVTSAGGYLESYGPSIRTVTR